VTIDVPHALGLHEDQSTAQINDKHIYYTDPIGTDDAVCRFILDLAYEAGMPHRANLEQLSTWSSFPQAGADLLVKQVQENANEGMEFGELLLKPDVVRPIGMSSTSINLDKPATLRAHIRENPFRPLASGRDLPRDWQVPVRNPTNIPAIVDTVYPGAVAAWAKQQQGQFTPNTLEGNIRRQQGNYKQLENLAEARIDRLVESVCGRCIKFPAWHKQNSKTNDIPCGDPCNVWLSAGLEALEVQEQGV